jgi:ATP-dependent exoDNAse (exonuclease V) beta subunit
MAGKDNQLVFPHFTVLKASAGSGKTYALARRFVLFLVSQRVPHNRLNNLLAITFSNNAAKEMKERILDLLKQICLGNKDVLAEFEAASGMPAALLQKRAEDVLEEILSSYSDFQVKTIDSFMTTVFKASAIDFGYDPDFEILLTNEALIAYAFDLFLRNVSEHTNEGALMERIVDAIHDNRRGESAFLWDPTDDILLQMEEIYRKIAACGKRVSATDYAAPLNDAKERMRRCARTLDMLVEQSGLAKSRASSYDRCLEAIKAGRFRDLVGKGMKVAPLYKPKGSAGVDAYEAVVQEWQSLKSLIDSYTRLFAHDYYTPYLRAFEQFGGILDRVKKHEAKIFIEDVNRNLAEYLDREMVFDVYFRLGEVIFHYLIDEFQDTSPIQWQNLYPLLENSLSQGGSLFVVGDTKQAIYGFRDADYTIMRNVETRNPFASAAHGVEELHVNYRSDEAIIDFTEDVFQRVLPGLDDYRLAGTRSGLVTYRQAACAERKGRGFVTTCLIARDDEAAPERDKVYEYLDDLRGRGYRYSDITILTQRNSDVVKVTSWLNERNIPFLSYSSLDVRKRRIAGEVVALLNFLDSPVDDLSFATFLLGRAFGAALGTRDGQTVPALHDLCFGNRRHGNRPLYKAVQEEMPELWDRYFDTLFKLCGYLPLYDLIVEIYRTFDLFALNGGDEEAALAKLLEVAKELELKGGSSLKGFLQSAGGDAGEDDWDIRIPTSVEAVKVMTIHKAKGLGFPVVLLLLYGERKKGFPYIVKEEQDGVAFLRLTKPVLEADADFEARYAEEELKETVNRLNSLYVAFTRAGRELHVIGVKREREAFPFNLFPNGMACSLGQPAAVERHVEEPYDVLDPFHHSAAAPMPAPSDEGIRFEERRRGELMHALLSGIEYVEDDFSAVLDAVIDRVYVQAGEETRPEGLHTKIAEFVASAGMRPYYERRQGRTVRVEQEIADSEGRLFRVDRLVEDPERITVIEYKTGGDGENEERHLAQMHNYMRIVAEVYGGRAVEGVIGYVDLKAVRHIGWTGV